MQVVGHDDIGVKLVPGVSIVIQNVNH
jgi:hypothetical protein